MVKPRYLLGMNFHCSQRWGSGITVQHCGIVVVIHNIFSIISIWHDKVNKKLSPCWSARADKLSPVVEHTLFLLTLFMSRWVPWWTFHHEFNVVDVLVLLLLLSRFSHFKVTSDYAQFQRNYNWVGFIKWVLYLYSMHGLTGNGRQKLWDFINQHTIHSILHQAEKVVMNALYFICMVDWKDNNLTCLRYGISNKGIY